MFKKTLKMSKKLKICSKNFKNMPKKLKMSKKLNKCVKDCSALIILIFQLQKNLKNWPKKFLKMCPKPKKQYCLFSTHFKQKFSNFRKAKRV